MSPGKSAFKWTATTITWTCCRHVRIYDTGEERDLPAIQEFRLSSQDAQEDERLEAEYIAENRRVAALLHEKGFCIEGAAPDDAEGPYSSVALGQLQPPELLALHARVIAALKRLRVCRTANNPLADYTEWLVAKKLGLRLHCNSKEGFDATDAKGNRYQIKARRLVTPKARPQLSVIRNLENAPFEYLIGVVYGPQFRIKHAAQVPYKVVVQLSAYSSHQHGHIMQLKDSVLSVPGVVDLTAQLQGADTCEQL